MYFCYYQPISVYVFVLNLLCNSQTTILHFSSCRVALRSAVFTAAQIRPSVSRHLEISFGLSGPPPRLLPSSGGVFPGVWGASNKENAVGAEGIFGNAECVWAPALPRTHLKKALCHTCPLGGASIEYHRRQYLTCREKIAGSRPEMI